LHKSLFEVTPYVALLRAVNVGGTGMLRMADLVRLSLACGFTNPRTYIASGNLVFHSPLTAAQVKSALEAQLQRYAGKPVGVLVRTAYEMAAVLANMPFKDAPPNQTVAIFLEAAPSRDDLQEAKNQGREQLALGTREIYVTYPDGMGRSKLSLPAAKTGTARNMNTIAKLVDMARA
jgi:uncharacterized protein (DUF1697 family)